MQHHVRMGTKQNERAVGTASLKPNRPWLRYGYYVCVNSGQGHRNVKTSNVKISRY